MTKIIDEEFGELTFDYAWNKQFKQMLFGVFSTVEIIVEGNDENESIREEQRLAYRGFIADNVSIMAKVEQAIFEYYNQTCDEKGLTKVVKDDIVNKVALTGIIFPMVINDGDISIGFLLEAQCDPEHGIGVKLINNELEISTQDILT